MNTAQLYKILASDVFIRRLGVFAVLPLDRLPTHIDRTKPAAFIVNTDPYGQPGVHWLGLYYNGLGTFTYFDSYGLPPRHGEILRFIERHSSRPYTYNTRQLQQLLSNTCGLYAANFLLIKARGGTLSTVLRPFINSTQQWRNDRVVLGLMRPWLRRKNIEFTLQ